MVEALVKYRYSDAGRRAAEIEAETRVKEPDISTGYNWLVAYYVGELSPLSAAAVRRITVYIRHRTHTST